MHTHQAPPKVSKVKGTVIAYDKLSSGLTFEKVYLAAASTHHTTASSSALQFYNVSAIVILHKYVFT